jgi:hypothetical protein
LPLHILRSRKAIPILVLAAAALSGCAQSQTPALPTTLSPSLEDRLPAAAAASTYAQTILQSDPVAYYQLNDSGSTLANSVTNGIAGSYGSAVRKLLPALTQGSTGAAGFPGGSSYEANGFASTAPSAQLQPAKPTVEAWFKLTASSSANTYAPLAIYGNQGTTYGMYLQGQGTYDTLFYQQTNSGASGRLLLHGLTDLKVGTTYHVVAVFDGSKVTTYVNGIVDQTASYAGLVGYAKTAPVGLQIGGQLASTRPSFPGSIAEVAIYGSPLSGQTVLNHFLAGQLVQMASETAVPADSFVDSIGINTHFDNAEGLYRANLSQVEALLVASGIRHFRDTLSTGATYYAAMKQLAASNIHGTYVTSESNTQSQIQSFPALVSPSLEQFEAPNEEDDQANQPQWEQPGIAFQKTLYGWVKGDSATAKYPVLGPAMAYVPDYQKLGNLSAYMDAGNFHDYMGAYNPGYPGGPYGGIKAMLADEKVTSGTKPVMSTESGYGTTSGSPGLDYATDLRYKTRQFFEQFNAGIVRSYSYEFLDEATTQYSFATFGLLTNKLVPKPAYTAVKALIGALQDPGSAFKAGSLTYSLTGLNTIHHLLMQKRDGTFILAIWQEVPGWNVSGGGDIAVSNQPVTLTTATHFTSASLSTLAETGSMSTATLPWTGTQTTIQVSDKVSLVTLKP